MYYMLYIITAKLKGWSGDLYEITLGYAVSKYQKVVAYENIEFVYMQKCKKYMDGVLYGTYIHAFAAPAATEVSTVCI